jgi:hypothetical protein
MWRRERRGCLEDVGGRLVGERVSASFERIAISGLCDALRSELMSSDSDARGSVMMWSGLLHRSLIDVIT